MVTSFNNTIHNQLQITCSLVYNTTGFNLP